MAKEFQALSDQLGDVVESAGAGLVRVEAGHRFGASGVAWNGDAIVTASHVVRREEEIGVGLPDGSTVSATLVGRDEATDLAVLRLPDPAAAAKAGVKPVRWSDGKDLRVGDLVLALSRPGRTVRAAFGIVAALGEAWRTGMGGRVDRYIETDTARGAGFSGGLLVGSSGQALGLNTAFGRHGPAVTLPAQTLQRVIPMLLAGGHVARGYLGVGAYPVRIPQAQDAAERAGLIVLSVAPEGPAAQAGVLQGDILVSVDGGATGSIAELRTRLDEGTAGRAARLSILRGGRGQELEVKLGTR